MLQVKKDLETDPEILSKKGRAAYEYVLKNNDWQDIGKKMMGIYSELEVINSNENK